MAHTAFSTAARRNGMAKCNCDWCSSARMLMNVKDDPKVDRDGILKLWSASLKDMHPKYHATPRRR